MGTSHRIPNLDYHLLMKLTLEITKDFSEVMKLYRLMCFNVFAPAYDLTYSYSLNGEHAATINGNGVNPDMEDLPAVAVKAGIGEAQVKKIACKVRDCVHERLAEYLGGL